MALMFVNSYLFVGKWRHFCLPLIRYASTSPTFVFFTLRNLRFFTSQNLTFFTSKTSRTCKRKGNALVENPRNFCYLASQNENQHRSFFSYRRLHSVSKKDEEDNVHTEEAASAGGEHNDKPPTCSSSDSHNKFVKNVVKHKEYYIEKTDFVDELNLGGVIYKHKKTGAIIVSMNVGNEETEKSFVINFRTPPEDSSGTTHIIEHSVLSGSEKYPLKDVFTTLVSGNMFSFLNAFTFPDMTSYLVSSVNKKDFYNIASVVLDSALNPLVMENEMAFQVEGHHYEIINIDDKNQEEEKLKDDENTEEIKVVRDKSELVVNGIVFNEMKGAYTSGRSLMSTLLNSSLLPVSYPYDSGGNPEIIPTLTYEKLKQYYRRHYNPKNCIIVFWGSDDVTDRLDFVHNNLINVKFDENSYVDTRVLAQPAIDYTRYVTSKYYAKEDSMKDLVTLGWVLNPKRSPISSYADKYEVESISGEELYELHLLSHLLTGTRQSALYKALVESNLGTNVIGGMFSYGSKHMTFDIGLEGLPQEVGIEKKVEDLIISTLETFQKKGFLEDEIIAAINHFEFHSNLITQPGRNAGVYQGFSIAKSMFLDEKDSLTCILRFAKGQKILHFFLMQYVEPYTGWYRSKQKRQRIVSHPFKLN